MRVYKWLAVVTMLVFIIGFSACQNSNSVATSVAATLSNIQMSTNVADLQTNVAYLQTNVAEIQTKAIPSHSLTPTNVGSPLNPTSTTNVLSSQKVLVKETALCLQGPGNTYEVVSSIKAGTQVELLGRGNKTLQEWLIIQNPTYKIPCWIADNYLQIDPNTDLGSLKIYNPPGLPTPGYPNP